MNNIGKFNYVSCSDDSEYEDINGSVLGPQIYDNYNTQPPQIYETIYAHSELDGYRSSSRADIHIGSSEFVHARNGSNGYGTGFHYGTHVPHENSGLYSSVPSSSYSRLPSELHWSDPGLACLGAWSGRANETTSRYLYGNDHLTPRHGDHIDGNQNVYESSHRHHPDSYSVDARQSSRVPYNTFDGQSRSQMLSGSGGNQFGMTSDTMDSLIESLSELAKSLSTPEVQEVQASVSVSGRRNSQVSGLHTTEATSPVPPHDDFEKASRQRRPVDAITPPTSHHSQSPLSSTDVLHRQRKSIMDMATVGSIAAFCSDLELKREFVIGLIPELTVDRRDVDTQCKSDYWENVLPKILSEIKDFVREGRCDIEDSKAFVPIVNRAAALPVVPKPMGHPFSCRPCRYASNCRNGEDCTFCHLTHTRPTKTIKEQPILFIAKPSGRILLERNNQKRNDSSEDVSQVNDDLEVPTISLTDEPVSPGRRVLRPLSSKLPSFSSIFEAIRTNHG